MKIAIIAHDGKKAQMVSFLRDYLKLFQKENVELIATGTTGSHVEQAGLQVQKVSSGPLGGDAEIAAEVAQGKIHAVIFFRDPLDKHPHEPDINMLMRICDVRNVPLATNPASGKFILEGLMKDP